MKLIFEIKRESSFGKLPYVRDMHASSSSLALTQRIGSLKILSYDAVAEYGEKGEDCEQWIAKNEEKETSPRVASCSFATR